MKSSNRTLFLTCLYLLQGLINGLFRGSLPILLREKFTLDDFAIYSLTAYPFAFKVFWAPMIDSFYITYFGKRKTWVYLTHFIIITLMMFISVYFEYFIEHKSILPLTILIIVVEVMVSMQDIAVDSWAVDLCEQVFY